MQNVKTTKICEVRAKLNPSERRVLGLIAQREVLNLSETLRALIREGARERGLWPPPGETRTEEERQDV